MIHAQNHNRYVQAVEVLASTRSPALKTGPFPAKRLRSVRRTMSPSSAIQRRCQTPHAHRALTTIRLTHRLIRVSGR